MPSIEWQRRWVDELNARFSGKLPYYGAHWGDPDPRMAFPRPIGAILPESWLAGMLRKDSIRNFLEKRARYEYNESLYHVLTDYLRPHITPDTVLVEIGPGGGRWTRYMLKAKHLYLVDINEEFFDYLGKRFAGSAHKFTYHKPDGYDLKCTGDNEADFVFSFGTFVHVEPEGIQAYLAEIARVLKPGCKSVVQYADKTKEKGQERTGFSDMTPEKMEGFIAAQPGLEMLEHNTELLNHSSVMLLQKSG